MYATAQATLSHVFPPEIVEHIVDYAFPVHRLVKQFPGRPWDKVGLKLVHDIDIDSNGASLLNKVSKYELQWAMENYCPVMTLDTFLKSVSPNRYHIDLDTAFYLYFAVSIIKFQNMEETQLLYRLEEHHKIRDKLYYGNHFVSRLFRNPNISEDIVLGWVALEERQSQIHFFVLWEHNNDLARKLYERLHCGIKFDKASPPCNSCIQDLNAQALTADREQLTNLTWRCLYCTEDELRQIDDSVWALEHVREKFKSYYYGHTTGWILKKINASPEEVSKIFEPTEDALDGRLDWNWNWNVVSMKGHFSWTFVENHPEVNWNWTCLSWRQIPIVGRVGTEISIHCGHIE